MIRWLKIPEIWSMTDVIAISHFGLFFTLLLTPIPNSPKIKILKKWKKLLEISSFYIYKCTKNFDQMMYGSWDMPHDGCVHTHTHVYIYIHIWIATENLQLPNLHPMKFNLSVKGTRGWSYTWFKLLLTLELLGKSGPWYCTLNHQ